MSKKTVIWVLCLIVVSSVLVGCSSNKAAMLSKEEKLSRDKTSIGANASAQIIGNAILRADGQQVHKYLSKSCQKKISADEITSQLNTSLSYLKSTLGVKSEDISIKNTQTRNVKPASTAEVRFTINISGESRSALESELRKQYSATSTTGIGQVPSGDSFVFPYDEPTEWMKFIYEDSFWRLKDCDEFFGANSILAPTQTR